MMLRLSRRAGSSRNADGHARQSFGAMPREHAEERTRWRSHLAQQARQLDRQVEQRVKIPQRDSSSAKGRCR